MIRKNLGSEIPFNWKDLCIQVNIFRRGLYECNKLLFQHSPIKHRCTVEVKMRGQLSIHWKVLICLHSFLILLQIIIQQWVLPEINCFHMIVIFRSMTSLEWSVTMEAATSVTTSVWAVFPISIHQRQKSNGGNSMIQWYKDNHRDIFKPMTHIFFSIKWEIQWWQEAFLSEFNLQNWSVKKFKFWNSHYQINSNYGSYFDQTEMLHL